ncbi:MAG: hypothetical protein WBE89_03320, partial [Methyloceanibacter sp.]
LTLLRRVKLLKLSLQPPWGQIFPAATSGSSILALISGAGNSDVVPEKIYPPVDFKALGST